MTVINLRQLYRDTGTAKLADLPAYEAQVLDLIEDGGEVVLTGQAPIWLYLRLSHVLHGRVRKLAYSSPVTGEVTIYDHNPY